MAQTLVFGAGWIGTQLAQRLGADLDRVDIANEQAVAEVLDAQKPEQVVNCAGKTGSPNVDACEQDPGGTYRSNVIGPIVLANACRDRDIHFTHVGSGCIYTGDNNGPGYAEDDEPNFAGSLYSRSKQISEAALRDLHALQLRLRMPISSEPGPRNLLSKLLRYPKVISVPNSVTVLDDCWEPITQLISRRELGVWNIVNPGLERHDELLRLYQQLVDPGHTFDVIELAALSELVVAGRSNCVLSTAKLEAAGLAPPPLEASLPRIVKAYGKALQGAG